MKKLLTTFIAVLAISSLFAQSVKDREAIKATALNYIEGWYSADTVRMGKALHPDLQKIGFMYNHDNKLIQAPATREQMIEWTSKRTNELTDGKKMDLTVEIIEVGQNIAMVKTLTPDFVDYIHMGKIDGEWRIYNVVWEFRQK